MRLLLKSADLPVSTSKCKKSLAIEIHHEYLSILSESLRKKASQKIHVILQVVSSLRFE